MKLLIKREILLEALNKVSKAISTKNLVPALAGIKFDLEENGLTLTASDNDIAIQVFIENSKENMEVKDTGSIIIQGKYILDIVRKLPTEYINITVFDEMKVIISTENSEYNLNGISKKEYPLINLELSKKFITLPNKVFKKIIYQTSFATSNDESRPVLTGINFKIVGNLLECNATDSYRLSRKTVNIQDFVEENYNIVIPSKNLVEFTKIVNDSEENIELHIFNNKILLKTENVLFQSRLINGTYPNTTNLLPKESILDLTVNVDDFYNVIDRVSILTSDKEKNIVTLETNKDKIVLRSIASEIGKVEEKMNVTKNNDNDITISFNAKFMMDALKAFEGKNINIAFVGEINPIVLKDTEDDSLIQLVTPNRVY